MYHIISSGSVDQWMCFGMRGHWHAQAYKIRRARACSQCIYRPGRLWLSSNGHVQLFGWFAWLLYYIWCFQMVRDLCTLLACVCARVCTCGTSGTSIVCDFTSCETRNPHLSVWHVLAVLLVTNIIIMIYTIAVPQQTYILHILRISTDMHQKM